VTRLYNNCIQNAAIPLTKSLSAPMSEAVISLKKLIDSNQEERIRAALGAYRAALDAMGKSGVHACPPLGPPLQVGLWTLQRQLEEDATPVQMRQTEKEVEAVLGQWGEQSARYYRGKTEEFKEIMMIMARTAQSVGDRDQRYSQQLTDFTTRLHSLASLDDLSQIRDSLVCTAVELQEHVDQIGRDGEEVVSQMRGELRQYQARLEEAERLASIDVLTGLKNRRRMELALEQRIAGGHAFSVILLDLDGFKQVNDTYGHAAGDDVLKQFGAELGAAFRAADDVGRWGGDEFVVVLDCGIEEARRHADRIRQWVFGDYVVRSGAASRKLPVRASIGAAEWIGAEPVTALLARADAEMYHEKQSTRRRGTVAP
jgi:diguanylate cyclase (GGDEF)-like protein